MNEAINIREIRAAQDAHEKLDDTRFDGMTKTLERVEAAIIDHAKASTALSERTSVRTHERMDGIVASIAKVAESVNDVAADLHKSIAVVAADGHKRVDGVIWSALFAIGAAAAWFAAEYFRSLG